MMLVRMGQLCVDSVILQRIVPLLLHALEDINGVVRAMGLRSLRSLLSVVRTCSSTELNLFPMYIFPALSRVVRNDHEIIVRVAFAESIGSFAESAKRFLDIGHLISMQKAIGTSNANGGSNASSDAFQQYTPSQKSDDDTPIHSVDSCSTVI